MRSIRTDAPAHRSEAREDLALNIFHLDPDPRKCAEYYVDSHVGKILLECCQMLCTTVWHLGGKAPYLPTHENHPMNRWVRGSYDQWYWTLELAHALHEEYQVRYHKTHACYQNCLMQGLYDPDIQEWVASELPGGWVVPPLCMPPRYQRMPEDYVFCYRLYYKYGKTHVHKWTVRRQPAWFDDIPNYQWGLVS